MERQVTVEEVRSFLSASDRQFVKAVNANVLNFLPKSEVKP